MAALNSNSEGKDKLIQVYKGISSQELEIRSILPLLKTERREMNWYNSRRDLSFERKNALGGKLPDGRDPYVIEKVRTPIPSIQEGRTYPVRTLVLNEDIWERLGAFRMSPLWEGREVSCHLTDRGQWCCYTSHNAQDTSTRKNIQTKMSGTQRLRKFQFISMIIGQE